MGSIDFAVNGNVNIDKNIDFDINKNVTSNVNVNNPFASALAEAQAIVDHENPIAPPVGFTETEAFATVTTDLSTSFSEAVAGLDLVPSGLTPGSMNLSGSTDPFDDLDLPNITITSIDPDVVTPGLDLETLYNNPPSAVTVDDFNFMEGPFLGPALELASDSIVNYGPVSLRVDYDGDPSTTGDQEDIMNQDMLLVYPAGTLWDFIFVDAPPVEILIVKLADDVPAGTPMPFVTFDGGSEGVIDFTNLDISTTFTSFNTGDSSTSSGEFEVDWVATGAHFAPLV